MTSKHYDPTRRQPRRDGVAPYNFVPMPEAVATVDAPPPHDRYDPELLTGKLVCTLTTASPLYVRAAQTPEQFAEKDKDRGTPAEHAFGETKLDLIIPGSSLRGMLRTMIEIVGHGRLAPVTDRRLFFRTVDETSVGLAYRDRMLNNVRGGFFHADKKRYWITPCRVVRVKRDDLLRALGGDDADDVARKLYNGKRPNLRPKPSLQGRRVFVFLPDQVSEDATKLPLAEDVSLEPRANWTEGTLVITGDVPKKKKEFVFVALKDPGEIPVDADMIEDQFHSDDQLTLWQRDAYPKGDGRAREGWLKDGDPVFYLPSEDGGGVEFFGRAYMFRLPYKHSPEEMQPKALRAGEGYDIAEAMFGMVELGKEGRGAVAGRVFVGDAKLEGDGNTALLTTDPIRLKILSGPKPTAIQHYLTQRYPDYKDCLDHYDDDPETESVLRGHKQYWHKGAVGRADIEADAADVLKAPKQFSPPVKPVKGGQTFTFEIRFENLRPAELGALLWMMDKAEDERYRLKLGMGKPYGMGSVAIHAEARLTDRVTRYTGLFEGDGWNAGLMNDADIRQKLNEARSAFARWLLDNRAVNPDGAANVNDLPRIKELLALLSWPGPDRERTRYMELGEFTGKGETGFDKRPVLPTPTAVLTGQLPATSPRPPDDAPCVERKKSKHSPETKAATPTRAMTRPARGSEPIPEPPKSDAEVSQAAKDAEAAMKKAAAEREAKEAARKQKKKGKQK